MADEPTEAAGGIGAAITQKLMESIQNMDVTSVLEKIISTTPEDAESEEARDKLKGVLDRYHGMTAEERAQFTAQIKNVLASKMSTKLSDKLSGLDEEIQSMIVNRLLLVGAGVLLLILIVVFFGYKLYKSIKEKEIKREEKKKLKQMKKKK